MADEVDRMHDFSEERVKSHLSGAYLKDQVPRGKCLYCTTLVPNLFCDDECKADWETEQLIKKRTRRN